MRSFCTSPASPKVPILPLLALMSEKALISWLKTDSELRVNDVALRPVCEPERALRSTRNLLPRADLSETIH